MSKIRFALPAWAHSTQATVQPRRPRTALGSGNRLYLTLRRFLRDETAQDFAEYALILGAIGVVAMAVIMRYRNELIAAFNAGIEALRMARGG